MPSAVSVLIESSEVWRFRLRIREGDCILLAMTDKQAVSVGLSLHSVNRLLIDLAIVVTGVF
jgi:hypothetical protein